MTPQKRDIPAHRVFLISQPKAGTHLYAALLGEIGYHVTHLHFSQGYVDAYDVARPEIGAASPADVRIHLPFRSSTRLIRTGEIGVGHIAFTAENEEILAPFKKIHIIREVRSGLQSFMRFMIGTGRFGQHDHWARADDPVAATEGYLLQHGSSYVQAVRRLVAWRDRADVLLSRYEAIVATPGEEVRRIADHLGLDTDIDGGEVLRRARGARTVTKAHADWSRRTTWSDRAEAIFADIGGTALNDDLGYARTGTVPV